MKEQVIIWIKNNWKTIKNILIGLGILFLLLSFISNWIQSDRYQKIKKDHKELKKEKEFMLYKMDSLKEANLL